MITFKQAQENMSFSKRIDFEITKASSSGFFYCIIKVPLAQLQLFYDLRAGGFDCTARRVGSSSYIDVQVRWSDEKTPLRPLRSIVGLL